MDLAHRYQVPGMTLSRSRSSRRSKSLKNSSRPNSRCSQSSSSPWSKPHCTRSWRRSSKTGGTWSCKHSSRLFLPTSTSPETRVRLLLAIKQLLNSSRKSTRSSRAVIRPSPQRRASSSRRTCERMPKASTRLSRSASSRSRPR